MTKSSAKSRSGKQLSAEEMSVRTGRAISHFPNNKRETSLEGSVTVTEDLLRAFRSAVSEKEPAVADSGVSPRVRFAPTGRGAAAPDRSRPSPQGRGPARSSRKNLVDKTASMSPKAQEAVERIGGILTGLSPSDRFAVLKKLNGTFGYLVKDRVPNQPAPPKTNIAVKAKPPPKTEPKKPHNEVFGESPLGKMLVVTSKAIKASSRNKFEKVSNEVHHVHKVLLGQKTAFAETYVRDSDAKPPEAGDIGEGEDSLVRLVRAMKHITTNSTLELTDASAAGIVSAAWCLCCGQRDSKLLKGDWVSDPIASWPDASITVPRTDEEATAAAARLLESRQAAKAKSKEKRKRAAESTSEERPQEKIPKGPISSGSGAHIPSTETPLEGVSEEAHEGMDLDGQESVESEEL